MEETVREIRTRSPLTREVEYCALCGGTSFEELTQETRRNARVVGCRNCGLFFSSPAMPFEVLQVFYCEEFEGDAGSMAAQLRGKVRQSMDSLISAARRRDFPIVQAWVGDLKGKIVLDLRSQSGALALLMQNEGAVVYASDPLLQNVEKCEEAGVSAYHLGVFEHSELAGFQAESFDVVSGLTIHVLAHLPQPREFLNRVYELLKPGGYLILEEKDTLKPTRKPQPGVFSTGLGHFYHFTERTMSELIRSCGFKVISTFEHPGRNSTFRHFVVVARKSETGIKEDFSVETIDWKQVRAELGRAEMSSKLKAPFNRLSRRIAKLVKKVRSR